MARTVRDAKLDSRAARARLKISGKPYYRPIDPGLHLGYRKGKTGGRWVARWYVGEQQYCVETLEGIADDTQDADGAAVLSYFQAQQKARERFVAAKRGDRPSSGPLTVKAACEAYIEYLAAERRTSHDTDIRLALHVFPALGRRPVAALTTKEVERCRNAMVRKATPEDPDAERRSKDSANRVLSMLKAALNRAFQDEANGIASDAAWRRVKPFKDVGRARQVHLDTAQSVRLINSCQGAFRNLVTAALLTGARPPHELAALRVRDFHAGLGALSIHDGKTGARTVTLTKEAVRFFEEISAGKEPDALLLPKDDGTAWGKNHHIRPMKEAVKKAKLPKETTLYALRHTAASQAILNGINLKLLAENMGTSIRMLEVHYGKFIAASRRDLIEAAGFKLGLPPGKVVRLEHA